MKVLKTVVLGILYSIGIIVSAVAAALTAFWGYFYIQSFLVGRGNYLLFVAGETSMIPVFMILILLVYAALKAKEKFSGNDKKLSEMIEKNQEPLNAESLNKSEQLILKLLEKLDAFDRKAAKLFRYIKICYIPALLITMYCGITSYAVLYTDSIKVSSPINPTSVVYPYSDIKRVDVGIEKGYRNSYSPYYTVTFDDEKQVNLFGDTMLQENGPAFEYILIDLDTKLRVQGVNKSVDTKNFEKYSAGLDADFIGRVRQLFR
jgi:hypothetical protein